MQKAHHVMKCMTAAALGALGGGLLLLPTDAVALQQQQQRNQQHQQQQLQQQQQRSYNGMVGNGGSRDWAQVEEFRTREWSDPREANMSRSGGQQNTWWSNDYEYDRQRRGRAGQWNQQARFGDGSSSSFGAMNSSQQWRQADQPQQQKQQQQQQRSMSSMIGSSQPFELSGELVSYQRRQLQGAPGPHTFVKMRLEDGRSAIVDLGSRLTVQDLDLRQGDRVSVTGQPNTINRTPVIMASEIKVNGEQHTTGMRLRSASGQRSGGDSGMMASSGSRSQQQGPHQQQQHQSQQQQQQQQQQWGGGGMGGSDSSAGYTGGDRGGRASGQPQDRRSFGQPSGRQYESRQSSGQQYGQPWSGQMSGQQSSGQRYGQSLQAEQARYGSSASRYGESFGGQQQQQQQGSSGGGQSGAWMMQAQQIDRMLQQAREAYAQNLDSVAASIVREAANEVQQQQSQVMGQPSQYALQSSHRRLMQLHDEIRNNELQSVSQFDETSRQVMRQIEQVQRVQQAQSEIDYRFTDDIQVDQHRQQLDRAYSAYRQHNDQVAVQILQQVSRDLQSQQSRVSQVSAQQFIDRASTQTSDLARKIENNDLESTAQFRQSINQILQQLNQARNIQSSASQGSAWRFQNSSPGSQQEQPQQQWSGDATGPQSQSRRPSSNAQRGSNR